MLRVPHPLSFPHYDARIHAFFSASRAPPLISPPPLPGPVALLSIIIKFVFFSITLRWWNPRGWRYSSLPNNYPPTSHRATPPLPLPFFLPADPFSSLVKCLAAALLGCFRSLSFYTIFPSALRPPAQHTVSPPAEHGTFLDRSHPPDPCAPPPT